MKTNFKQIVFQISWDVKVTNQPSTLFAIHLLLLAFELHNTSKQPTHNADGSLKFVNGTPFCPSRPPAPSIHVCENPLMEVGLYGNEQRPSMPSFPSNISLSQRQSPSGDERLKSPSSMFNQSNTSHCNHQQFAHKERLFSLGPSFHIQLKHPSSVQLFKWRKRTKLEKHCIFIVVCLLLIYPITVLILYNNIDKRGMCNEWTAAGLDFVMCEDKSE